MYSSISSTQKDLRNKPPTSSAISHHGLVRVGVCVGSKIYTYICKKNKRQDKTRQQTDRTTRPDTTKRTNRWMLLRRYARDAAVAAAKHTVLALPRDKTTTLFHSFFPSPPQYNQPKTSKARQAGHARNFRVHMYSNTNTGVHTPSPSPKALLPHQRTHVRTCLTLSFPLQFREPPECVQQPHALGGRFACSARTDTGGARHLPFSSHEQHGHA